MKKKGDTDILSDTLTATSILPFSEDDFFKALDRFLDDLDAKDKKKMYCLAIVKPKIMPLIFYIYTEPKWLELRIILFATVLFSKLAEVTNDKDFRNVFTQEQEDLKSEIYEIADVLRSTEWSPAVWQKVLDLPVQFTRVLFADFIYLKRYGDGGLSVDPKERGDLVRGIRESIFKEKTRTTEDGGNVVERIISLPEEPVVTFQVVTFPDGRINWTTIIDFSDLNEAKKFKQLRHPVQYFFVEWLTEEYKELEEKPHLKNVQNILLIDRGWDAPKFSNEVSIVYDGKEIYRFPMSLFHMVRPVVNKAIKYILFDKTRDPEEKEKFTSEMYEKFLEITGQWNLELEDKDKELLDRFKLMDVCIACAIHDMAIHFPQGFEKIMGYYKKRAEFERRRIADRFEEKHPTESLDESIRMERPGSREAKVMDKKDLIQSERYRKGEIEDEEQKLISKIWIEQTETKLEDPSDKEIFRGMVLEGKTQKEIADILRISKPAVFKRINKIAEKIKKMSD